MSDTQDNVDTTPAVTVEAVVAAAVETGLIDDRTARNIVQSSDSPEAAARAVAVESNRPISEVRSTLEATGLPVRFTEFAINPNVETTGPRDYGSLQEAVDAVLPSTLGPVGTLVDQIVQTIAEINPTYADRVGTDNLVGLVRNMARELEGAVSERYAPIRADMRYQSAFANQAADTLGIERHQFIGLVGDNLDATKENLREALINQGKTPEEADDIIAEIVRSTDLEVEAVQATEAEVEERAAGADFGSYTEEERERLRSFLALNEQRPGAYYWDSSTRQIRLRTGATDANGQEAVQPGQVVDETGAISLDTAFLDEEPPEDVPLAPWVRQGISEVEYRAVEDISYTGGLRGDNGMVERVDPDTGEITLQRDESTLNVGSRDAARFVPGGPSFLGGMPSTYRVDITREEAIGRVYGGYQLPPGYDLADLESRLTDNDLAMLDREYTTGRRPIYEENMQWSKFTGMSEEYRADYNQQMIDLGLLTREQLGGDLTAWGFDSAKAMGEWMTLANWYGTVIDDVEVTDTIKAYTSAKKAAAGPQLAPYVPATYRSLDEATVSQTVKQLLRNSLRRDPTDDEIAMLGDYLSEQHREAFVADESASRAEYDARRSAVLSDATYAAAPGEVADVDYESRFMEYFENQFAQNLSFEREGRQANEMMDMMGGAMDNFMRRLGGGIG